MAPARKPFQKESIAFQPSILGCCCWWKESQTTTRDEKNPVNNGMNYQPQLVQDFFHQQYLSFREGISLRLKIYLMMKEEPMEKQHVPLKFEVFVA